MNVFMTMLICLVSAVMIVACVDLTANFFAPNENNEQL